MMPNKAQHVVIVGGSRGLGRGAVEEHLERGWTVTATVRQTDVLDDLRSSRLSVLALDILDWPAIDAVAGQLSFPIDRLFLIAGESGSDGPIGETDPAAFSHVMLVNALAPLRIIERWAALLAPDALVAIMSSVLGSVARNDSAGRECYRMSKAAANMGLRSIAARRRDDRTYLAINPGRVRTAIGGAEADLSSKESISRVVDVLDRHAGERRSQFLDVADTWVPW